MSDPAIEVAAGVKASLIDYVATNPAVRVLDGRFMVIEQAMVTVHGPDALKTISALIEELKASGFVARELERTNQTEASASRRPHEARDERSGPREARCSAVSGAFAACRSTRAVASQRMPVEPLIALVHTQAAGDDGITDDMIASFRRVAAEQKLRARVIYASDPTNYEPILELLGEYGAQIVLGTFDEMGQPMSSVAPNFPATRFVQIYGDPLPKPLPNMRTVAYDTYLGAYLVGVCGALVSRTGKIGYIGGASIPPIDADANAMQAGLRSVHPDRSLITTFIGSFQDPAKAFQITEQMYRSGIDFIQVEGAGSDLGVIKSAMAKPGRMVSGAANNEDRLRRPPWQRSFCVTLPNRFANKCSRRCDRAGRPATSTAGSPTERFGISHRRAICKAAPPAAVADVARGVAAASSKRQGEDHRRHAAGAVSAPPSEAFGRRAEKQRIRSASASSERLDN